MVKLEQITVTEASGKQTDVRDRHANTRSERYIVQYRVWIVRHQYLITQIFAYKL